MGLRPIWIEKRGWNGGAKRDASRKGGTVGRFRGEHLADPRTETVRADHEVGDVFCRRIALRPFDDGLGASGCDSRDGGSQINADPVVAPCHLRERLLQVGAVKDQIRRSPTPFGVLERKAHESRVVRSSQRADRVGRHGRFAQLIERTKTGQNPRGVRGELQPRAIFLERRGPLVDRCVEACPRESERRRQTANASAGYDRAQAHLITSPSCSSHSRGAQIALNVPS